MKKLMLLLVLAGTVLLAAACGGQTAGPGFAKEDLAITVGGTIYRCGDAIETVVADLGDGYGYAEGMSCDYDGLDKTYTYEAAIFYTNPLAAGDMLEGIYTTNPAVSTSKGISAGSAKADVLAAYGEADEDLGDLLVYRVEGERASLSFELNPDDTVYSIYLTTQPV